MTFKSGLVFFYSLARGPSLIALIVGKCIVQISNGLLPTHFHLLFGEGGEGRLYIPIKLIKRF